MPKPFDLKAVFARNKALFGDIRMETATLTENPLITQLRDNRDASQGKLDALLKTVSDEKRSLTTDEDAKFVEYRDQLKAFDDRIAEMVELDKRSADAAAARAAAGDTGDQHAHVTDPAIYAKDKADTSYFRDLYHAQRAGDPDAADRLRRNSAMTRDDLAVRWDKMPEIERRFVGSKPVKGETRAMGNTGAAGGSGGEFAPPAWLISDFVGYARPGRIFLDSLNPMPLPSGISSINIPKVSGGTTTAIQTTQNSALSSTDMTTTSISSNISTIGGKNVVSLQLLQQSGIPFDQVILQDLAEDYAQRIDVQAISGSGASGQLEGVYTYFTASGTVSTAYTTGSPVVVGTTTTGFYQQIFVGWSKIASNRFKTPDTIWMSPRRWAWILMTADTTNRPLVVPKGSAYNPLGGSASVDVPEGVVGNIGGLDVIIDANIPTNLGSGTNQDPCLIGVRSDLRVWESPIQLEAFDATYADSAGVLFRALGYSAAIPSRYTTSVAVINGTGMVAPF